MTQEPLCIFCQQKFSHVEKFPNPHYPNNYHYRNLCQSCKSIQLFNKEKVYKYWFTVGQYQLYFDLEMPYFSIVDLGNDINNSIFKLNFIPDYTPQNLTEDKIKTLITFS